MSKELFDINARTKTPIIGAKSCIKQKIEKVFVKTTYYNKFAQKLKTQFKTIYVLSQFPMKNFNYSVVGFK